jgi:hypothetical protein
MTLAEAAANLADGYYKIERASQTTSYCWGVWVEDGKIMRIEPRDHDRQFRFGGPERFTNWTLEDFQSWSPQSAEVVVDSFEEQGWWGLRDC